MGWQALYSDKLVTPEEAVRVVRSGDAVAVSPFTSTPYTLCEALYDRRHELSRVRIDHLAGLFPWVQPESEGVFELHNNYATAVDRQAIREGKVGYVPIGHWHARQIPEGFVAEPDVYLMAVSPPDSNGFCSFGSGVWFSPIYCRQAKAVVAEVHEDFIRTGGENYVHISQIDCLTEARRPTGHLNLPARSEEETAVTEVICTLVASELVRDGDTIQIGIGTVSTAMGFYLHDKRDLGVQTEILTGGIAALVREGVVTGRRKTLHQGKVVASALVALPPEELAYIDGNPVFELYDFGYTDDLRYLIQHQSFTAINNALLVDLTGQVTSEYAGPQVWTGVGGQTVFCLAAAYSPGGRSIIVTPSSHLLNGQRVSRLVPGFEAGTAITVPRTYVDYVVTEYGIATLRGKTVRERVQELISVAHPDFRGELRKAAARLSSA